MLTFNNGNLLTLLSQSDCEERTGLAGADYDRVKFFCHTVLSFAGDTMSLAMRHLRSQASSR